MNKKTLLELWQEEEKQAFHGWDFSHLQGRWESGPLNWNYKALVQQHLKSSDRLLDLETGGGEFLLSLGHPYQNTAVTEAWEPNIRVCEEKLAPLGITVYPVRPHTRLPIPDAQFNLVIDRHGEYDADEVFRVLKPNGMMITQQVGGENALDFAGRVNPFEKPAPEAFSLDTELPRWKAAGFRILQSEECYPELCFFDVGAAVFWMKQISWTFPGFSVERNRKQLFLLQEELEQNGFVSVRQHRFLIVARK